MAINLMRMTYHTLQRINDLKAIRKGKIMRRIGRRIMGRLTGRFMGRLLR